MLHLWSRSLQESWDQLSSTSTRRLLTIVANIGGYDTIIFTTLQLFSWFHKLCPCNPVQCAQYVDGWLISLHPVKSWYQGAGLKGSCAQPNRIPGRLQPRLVPPYIIDCIYCTQRLDKNSSWFFDYLSVGVVCIQVLLVISNQLNHTNRSLTTMGCVVEAAFIA